MDRSAFVNVPTSPMSEATSASEIDIEVALDDIYTRIQIIENQIKEIENWNIAKMIKEK